MNILLKPTRLRIFQFVLILLFVLNFSIKVQAQWHKVSCPTSISDLNSVHFPDSNTGYAVGFSGDIIKTTDAGKNWVKLETGLSANIIAFTSVYFINADTGFAIGGDIYKTINGGKNWRRYVCPDFMRSVYFTSPEIGYAVGNEATILKTLNGGTIWIKCDKVPKGLTSKISSVFFPDAANGYAVSWGGEIIKTTDSGATWKLLKKRTGVKLYAVYFTSVDTGYICGDKGKLLKTVNGGITWKELVSSTESILASIHFNGKNTGYICGEDGIILKTTDAGATWKEQYSGTNNILTDIYFPNTNTGYIVGFKQTILKTNCKIIINNKTSGYVYCYVNGAFKGIVDPYGDASVEVESGTITFLALTKNKDGSTKKSLTMTKDCFNDFFRFEFQ